jgi:hypothetical protein
MAASRLLPLAIAGIAIAGTTAWIIGGSSGDDTPVAAEPEAESTPTGQSRGLEAGSFQEPPTAQPETQPTEPSEPAAESTPGTVEAVPGNSMLGVAPPPAPPIEPAPSRPPTTQQEDALARSIDSATTAWTTRLKLDAIQQRGLRDAFEANAIRQEEMKKAAAEGTPRSELLALGQENREALLGDLQGVLTSSQLAEYVSITGGDPDGGF